MTRITRTIIIALTALAAASCGNTTSLPSGEKVKFPVIDQQGRIAIVAHRGFWNCDAGGHSQNSIASLKAAQDNGLWGSECDLQLTSDGVVIVNHNNDIDGVMICDHTWDELKGYLLPNGERRPTVDEYLDQTAKCRTTRLIIEFKKQGTPELEDELVDKTIAAMKAHKLYSPKRIAFISFSKHICEKIAAEHPAFVNQFLTSSKKSDQDPVQYAEKKINGIDYQYNLFFMHPEWIATARRMGMSVNAWTVDGKEDIIATITLGVNQITTNEPLLVRQILGPAEYKLGK